MKRLLLPHLCALSILVSTITPIPATAEPLKDGVMYPLKSSLLRWAMYEGKTMVLTLQHSNGGTFEYYNVPRSVFEKLVEAELPAGFLKSEVSSRYPSQQLRKRALKP